jgi:MFS family permease
MQRNIYLLYGIKFSKWLMLYMPVIVVFFQNNGLSLTQIMVIQAVYSSIIAITEVPSGYFSDKMGRKLSLLIGTFFGSIGIAIYAFSYNFYAFLNGALFLGLSQSFISGTDTALLYDSLKNLGKEKDFIKHEGRIVGFGNFAEAVAFIIGGIIASYSLRLTLIIQIPLFLSGFIFALFVKEPKVEYVHFKKLNILEIVTHTFKKNKNLKQAVWFSSIIGFGTLTMAWFIQPYYLWLNIPIVYFGILGAALNLTVAFFSFYITKITQLLKEKTTYLLISIGIPLLYIILSLSTNKLMLIFVFVFYAIRGIATPLLRNQINKYTSSEIRATVMSIRSLLIRILFAIFSPFLGYITDKFSLSETLLLSGVLVFLMLIFSSLSLLIQIIFDNGKNTLQKNIK